MTAKLSCLTIVIGLAGATIGGCNADAEPTADGTSALRNEAAADAAAPAPATVTGSQMESDLRAAGLDPHALPALESLDSRTRIKVMTTFTRALGVECNFCHDTSNYEASTPNKRITARMWSDFVRGLALKDGSVLYCDSCHGGKSEFLDRSDAAKLRTWMKDNFIGKLQRTDGAEHRCKTCHSDPFQGDIFKDVWHAED